MTVLSFRQILASLQSRDTQSRLSKTFRQVNQEDTDQMADMLLDSRNNSEISCSQSKKNYDLNRYSNVVPFDKNRVKLSGSGYINASHIELPSSISANRYIATQGPLPHSVGHFWQMAWEQNASTVVMLTNPTERSRTKCAVYWPNTPSNDIKIGRAEKGISVKLQDEQPLEGCLSVTLRRLELSCQNQTRIVNQLHYTEWPDHSVPDSPEPLIRLIDELDKYRADGPVIVHCSAGVGRTGTFIILDAARKYFAKNHNYNGDFVEDSFRCLRKQRTLMVQTPDQYYMLYTAINYFTHSKIQ